MSGGSGPTQEAPDDIIDAERSSSPLAANLVGGGAGRNKASQQRPRGGPGGNYSRFVASMKILLPFLALGLITLIVIWPRLKTEDTFSIGFSTVRMSGSSEPGVDNARFMGTDDKRRPYSITADLARIDSKIDGLISLEMPKADLTLEDGTWLVLTADNGRYYEERQQLELDTRVNLFHDTGYEIVTDQLVVDLKNDVAVGNTPVAGHGPFGELKSEGIKLINRGRVIYFTGQTNLTLYPSQGGQDDAK